MKARNPEAIKLENSREVRLLPETPEELRQAQYASYWPTVPPQVAVKPQESDVAQVQEVQKPDT